jgi:NarL family two-component system response regulator LiaR
MTFFAKYKLILVYGVSLAILLVILQWLQIKFIIFSHSFEIYAGAIAIIFTAIGIWASSKLIKPKVEVVTVEKEVFIKSGEDFVQNEKEIEKLGLSKRELEVLEQMAAGLSNQEIADKLFLSLNTVKTHSTNLFVKLDVQRRTQAVEKAKRSGLIP